jgi:uncharacterized protein YbaP (TraB family)
MDIRSNFHSYKKRNKQVKALEKNLPEISTVDTGSTYAELTTMFPLAASKDVSKTIEWKGARYFANKLASNPQEDLERIIEWEAANYFANRLTDLIADPKLNFLFEHLKNDTSGVSIPDSIVATYLESELNIYTEKNTSTNIQSLPLLPLFQLFFPNVQIAMHLKEAKDCTEHKTTKLTGKESCVKVVKFSCLKRESNKDE